MVLRYLLLYAVYFVGSSGLRCWLYTVRCPRCGCYYRLLDVLTYLCGCIDSSSLRLLRFNVVLVVVPFVPFTTTGYLPRLPCSPLLRW